MGGKLTYAVYLLLYAYQHSDTPTWAKTTALGAIGYLLSPFDGIPDLTPFIGFTDDMSVVMFSLVAIACYIDDGVRSRAQARVLQLFPSVSDDIFTAVDRRL